MPSEETQDQYIPEFTLGDRLRKIRTDKGLKQTEFAVMIGLSSSTLAAYEAGYSNPRFKDARALAQRVEDATRVPAWWLLEELSPLSDSNRRPPLYIVDDSPYLDDCDWPDEAPKVKQSA